MAKKKTIRDSVEQVKSAIIITAIEELEKEIKGLIDSTAPVQDPDLAEAKKLRKWLKYYNFLIIN